MNWGQYIRKIEACVDRNLFTLIIGIFVAFVILYLNYDKDSVKFAAYLLGGCMAIWLTSRRVEAIVRNVEIAESRQSIERFTSSVELIGNDSSCVTVGAVHALHRMAIDDEGVRVAVFHILCEFLRQKSENVETNVKKIAAKLLFESREPEGTIYSALKSEKAYLPDLDMTGWDLSEYSFQSAILTSVCLDDANLKGANFNGAEMLGANLSKIKVNSGTTMKKADLRLVTISSTNLENGVDFTGANMGGSKFNAVDFSNCNFSNVTMNEATFKKSKFHGAINLTKDQLATVSSLYACEGVPKNIEDKLKQDNPDLFRDLANSPK